MPFSGVGQPEIKMQTRSPQSHRAHRDKGQSICIPLCSLCLYGLCVFFLFTSTSAMMADS
jgi:hypothetical protein